VSLDKSETAHRTAGLVYCLWLLGILFGVTAIIGIYINHSKLHSVRGTHAYSHFIWQIGSFWTVLAGVVISLILWPAPVAWPIAVASFSVWIFSGMIGSWYLAKSKKMTLLSRKSRTFRHPQHLRHETYDQPESTS